MKSLKIKIGDLFKALNCLDIPYEEIVSIADKSLYIRNPFGDLSLIQGLMRKRARKVKLTLDNEEYLICADKHILYDGNYKETFAEDCTEVLTIDGVHKVINKEFLDEDDLYDVALNYPHLYVTVNGIIHHNTMLACSYAMDQLSKGNYERLIITRNAIGCGRSIGFFPGEIEDKMASWCAQVLSFCKQFVGTEVVENWMRGPNPKIILEPMEVIRGRSYENSIIIVEEAQQCSIQDLKCLTTRIGKDSLMILNGDPVQKDIKDSGLETFCKLVKDYHIDDIGVVKFTVDDILRHDVVRQLVIAFQKEGL